MIDDTKLKSTDESQQRDAEERFRSLSESSLFGVYLIQDMKLGFANRRLCEILGYSFDELQHKVEIYDLIYPDDLELLIDLRERWDKREIDSFEVELRVFHKTQKVLNLQVFGSRIHTSDKMALVGTVIDDTDNRSILEGFRESLESYKTLFDSIGDAIYIQSENGSLLEVNDGAVNMYGYEKSFFPGKYPEILAAPGKVKIAVMEDYFALALAGEPQRFEWWGRRKNGEIFPGEIQLNPGYYFGERVVIAIVRDITEQYFRREKIKESEEMLRQLFQNSPIGIAMLDQHKEVTKVNKGFEEIFGYKQEEIIGLDIDKLIVPEEKVGEAVALTNSEKTFELTTQRTTKYGEVLDVIIYGVPVVVDEKTIAIYGIYVDITDRRKAEYQLEKSLKEKEILLAEIHHRVKNNLAVIMGLLELQSYNTDNEDTKKVLKDSQLRINSMALIHEKLYQSENLSSINFDVYLNELMQVITRAHQSKQTPVEFILDCESVPMTITQAIPCGLILNEIVTNSLKHAFHGREDGEIRIIFVRVGDKLKLTISDNGIGLPDNYKEAKTKSLGMTLINTLAKQLEAELRIDSTNGTLFELIFDSGKAENEK